MAEHILKVIREHRFERELRRLVCETIPAGQFVEAAEFFVARDPLIGAPIDDDGLVCFLSMAPIEGERVSLCYAFDQSTGMAIVDHTRVMAMLKIRVVKN